MKPARKIGLIVVAVIASMGLVGASSAMAETTALCKVDETPCSEANQVTEVHYEADNINILTPTGGGGYDYGCSHALLSATVSKLAETQTLEGQSLTYSSCGGGCTRTTIELGTLSVLRTEGELAEITANGFEVNVSCSGFTNCRYSFNEQSGTLKGPLLTGDNGHITFQEAPLERVSGFLCPELVKLDALFVASKPVYVKS
jgi:hypothetical protein